MIDLALAKSIKDRVAHGEISGPEGQRLIAERWGVDLAQTENDEPGITLFDVAATQAFDDYLHHGIPATELQRQLRGHQFFVPFPKGA
ncbi:MAG: hypothetical protein ACTHOG_10065 [Marmoricola sp.]